MLMYFIVTTLAFTVAILLASFISTVVVLSKPFSKWSAKKIQKITLEILGEPLFEEYKFEENESV